MVLDTLSPLGDKLVLMGMSCVGKTTLASSLAPRGYAHRSFDAVYTYSLASLSGVSRRRDWARIISSCTEDRFVLDNWTTEDPCGETLYSVCPTACVVVLFDARENVLGRYRAPVTAEDRHRGMYDKMYRRTPFEAYRRVRFLRVDVAGGAYREYDLDGFRRQVALLDVGR